MKALLIGEVVQGKLAASFAELLGFAETMGAETVGLMLGDSSDRPAFGGKLYVGQGPEYAPKAHKAAALAVIEQEQPDLVVLMHSAYGWDLAPRLALAQEAAQISEVVGYDAGLYQLGCCNGKLQRKVTPKPGLVVVTIQAGAFAAATAAGSPQEESIAITTGEGPQLTGYQPKPAQGVDLSKAEKIVSGGRGIGKPENLQLIRDLADALGAQVGASRPVVDSGWIEAAHQVGSTGATVTPKLYMACGISGAVQHLAGMKKSEMIIAVNKDKEAPIGEVAQYIVVADLLEFVPALTAALKG
ncbi:MAG: electron transfer flavoprotein subunit alpha/FixB family protein [bacterium]|nr:electron transfer flavoprotein subunit alpha/FixB family protein [bacterium]